MSIARKNVGTGKDEWGTPDWLFDLLNSEADFKGDVAATSVNAKCKNFYTKEDNALQHGWFSTSFLNPPHSMALVSKFMHKARVEARSGAKVWCLVPVDASTQWWHRSVMEAQEIRFIEGRVDYIGVDLAGNPIVQSPTFASCIVIFDNDREPPHEKSLTVCGLDEPCEEAYTKYDGQRCPSGYKNCYNDDFSPIIGKTIKVPKKGDRKK